MKRKFLSCLLITFFLSSPLLAVFKTTIHRVGAGNCVVIEDTDTKTYMIVDCGSSEFEPSYRVKSNVEKFQSGGDKQSNVLRSEKKIIQKKQGLLELKEVARDDIKKKILAKIKQSLGDPDNEEAITVRTIFITHPDRDHYDFLSDLIINTGHQKDKIEFLVLGGDPLKYDSAIFFSKKPLKKWIKDMLRNGTELYFLALNNDCRHVKNKQEYERVIRGLKNGENIWGGYQARLDNKEAFPFLSLDGVSLDGEKTKSSTIVTLFGVNSLHATDYLGEEKIITRLNYSQEEGGGDDNADSFLIKVANKNEPRGILLTGDATALTTKRLLNLKEDVTASLLLASHHGASSDGSNNESWIEAVNPDWVFISSGLLHGHPTQAAYENFQKSKTLSQHTTNIHKMITGEKTEEKTSSQKKKEKIQKNTNKNVTNEKVEEKTSFKNKKAEQEKMEKFQYKFGTTNRPIFSTLANGTLVAAFNSNKDIKLSAYLDKWKDQQLTEKIKEVQIFSSGQTALETLENEATIDINETAKGIEVEEECEESKRERKVRMGDEFSPTESELLKRQKTSGKVEGMLIEEK